MWVRFWQTVSEGFWIQRSKAARAELWQQVVPWAAEALPAQLGFRAQVCIPTWFSPVCGGDWTAWLF